MKKKFIIKTVLFILFILVIQIAFSSVVPFYSNDIAMEQMKDNYMSSSYMRIYQVLSDYRYIAYVIIGVLVYLKNIVGLLKEKKEDGQENDEQK